MDTEIVFSSGENFPFMGAASFDVDIDGDANARVVFIGSIYL